MDVVRKDIENLVVSALDGERVDHVDLVEEDDEEGRSLLRVIVTLNQDALVPSEKVFEMLCRLGEFVSGKPIDSRVTYTFRTKKDRDRELAREAS